MSAALLAPGRPQRLDCGHGILLGERAEHELAAARADRRQDAPRLMRDEQEQRALRRLLDEFEKRIGGAAVEIVGAVDDGDAPAAHPGALMKGAGDLAHVVDADLGEMLLGLLVPLPPQQEDVGERHGRDATRGGMRRRHGERLRGLHRRRRRVRMGQQKARETPGERRLADPLRPADDPCLRETVALDRRRAVRAPPPHGRRARASRADAAPRRNDRSRMDPPAALLIARRRPAHRRSRASTSWRMARAMSSAGWPASMTQQRSGSCSAMSRKARRRPS